MSLIINNPNAKTRDVEEIRVRCLVANRTGETALLDKIDNRFAFAGLYPEVMGRGDEIKSEQFRSYVENFPDIKEALIKHNLWI